MSSRLPQSAATPWVPDAIPFFLFGFVYYLLSPVFALRFLSADSDLLFVATRYVDESFFDPAYYLDAAAICASFAVGYWLARLATRSRRSALDFGAYRATYPLLLALVFLALIVFLGTRALASGATLFSGYSTYNILVLGPFSTCAFMSAWFVNYFSNRQVRLLFLAFFLVCSALLLGWGSRMFFVLGFVALTLGVVSTNRWLLRSVPFYACVLACGVLALAVGVLRDGDDPLSLDGMIAVFFAEPLFTSISGALYLENSGGRPAYGVPYDLAAGLIHFIPSPIFPGKIELMSAIGFDENIESPFGAKALIVNLYSNFGMLYPLYLAAVGAYYGFLQKRARHSAFFRATYFSALPILPLLFYREGIETVVKVTMFNGLVVPLAVALLLVWTSPWTASDIRRRLARQRC